MEITIKRFTDWQRVVNATRMTVGKEPIDHEPSDKFKHMICRSEHSPLRLLEFDIILKDVPSFVQNQIVRHKQGVEFFVCSSRPDRGNQKPRSEQRKTDPCDMQISINAQAILNISRKRMCRKAEGATRLWWQRVIYELGKIEPILASYCWPDCVYKSKCTEAEPCGWWEKHKEQFNNSNNENTKS